MACALVIYYSRSGNTRKMAEKISEGFAKEKVEVVTRDVKDVHAKDLLKYDALVMGSPTYYGTMAADIKRLLDDSVEFHGEMNGKIGGAFSSSANIGGGNETTILDILNAMLIHGMIIQGDPDGDHYGPVSVGAPDARVARQCLRFGVRLAGLTKKLKD
jgi:NAD(P)H dehydrogenase (quinone)